MKVSAKPVLHPPLVTGRDLIPLGHKPGPHFSKLLQDTYDRQLDGLTDKPALLASVPPPKT